MVNVANSETAKPALGANPTGSEQVVAGLEALLLTVWLGAMTFFSFAVAPTVFAVLPTRELAGQLVNSLIAKLELLGLICGPLLLLSQLFVWPKRESEAKARVLRVILLGLMTLLVLGSRSIRSTMIPAERILPDFVVILGRIPGKGLPPYSRIAICLRRHCQPMK